MLFIFNSNKMFFLFILFFSTLISISSNSWFGCWIGLEINLLSFIPLISNSNNLLANEASLKYFLTQSIASVNFLFMILFKLFFFKNFFFNNFMAIMMNSSMLMKMGAAPFHFWFPTVAEGLSWLNNFILMSWQKISPMILLSYYFNQKFLLLILLLNSIIGAIGGFSQTSLRKILAFSSINNLSWILTSMLISENLWMFYFFFYSFLIMIMCFFFNMFNMFFINQIYILNFNPLIKFSLMINMLSLGGLPPLIGFFPKWMIINFLLYNNLKIISFIFIMMSLILLFFYIRIFYASFMLNYMKLKWMKTFIKNLNFNLINLFSMISIMGMLLSTFFFY
uniref:NADH dehydrogenase subunit 2 n=1 Tax=Chibiraga houshuaii TaxID=3085295 RepID=UPI002A82ECEC|nr:NADH dehydrogenase subunit 2 [Chibiraga houshuaii]WOR75481.1 NADH dehydrogenase subunit 2 [Chibiraga houshuaii]